MIGQGVQSAGIRERLLQGDCCALADLFVQHKPQLERIVKFRLDRRISPRLDPDDILQDAFLDALLRLKHFAKQPRLSPASWLRMIVIQTLLDAHRRHLSTQLRSAKLDHSLDAAGGFQSLLVDASRLFATQITPETMAMRAERAKILQRLIAQMEPKDRSVLMLRHYDQLGNNEVATRLNISVKAASIRYFRALARLKQILIELPEFDAG